VGKNAGTMSEAKTLLQVAGAKPTPAKLLDAAVVVIDAQNEYVSGRLPLASMDAALAQLADLLAAARAAGAPIIHVAQRGRPGGLFDPESANFQFVAQAAPLTGEAVVEKSLPNAFAKTDLDAKLQATGKKALVIAGFMTHMCISATTRSALDHGYTVTVASDAVATRDLPDPLGGPDLPAEQVNRTALAELADRFATVAPVAEIKIP
jgi:nicotinamidase-related amidase